MKEWRVAHGLTQRRLAALLDVDQITISRWESGRREPPGVMLELALAELDRRLSAEQK